jgi:hypothetical protein
MIQRLTITPDDCTAIPGIIAAPEKEKNSVVFVLHGLNVCKETQIPDIESLANKGFHTIAIDAPHHGERKDGFLEYMQDSSPRKRHQLLLYLIQQQVLELDAIVKFYQQKLQKKVAVIGISMGGFVAFGCLRNPNKPDFISPFLASPNWRDPQKNNQDSFSILEKSGPADFPDEALPTPLLIVNASLDTTVPAKESQIFYKNLQPTYLKNSNKIEYFEYPESEHMMRPDDWFNAWDKVIGRLEDYGF